MTTNHTPPTQTPDVDLEAELGAYGRDLHQLRAHAAVVAHYLGDVGIPRGETRMTLHALIDRAVNDAFEDLAQHH